MKQTKTNRVRRLGPRGRARAARMKAVRAALRQRAMGRCEVPWCRTSKGPLDPHHVVKRSQGGADDRRNCLLLCRPHHRAAERQDLRIVTYPLPDGAVTWHLSWHDDESLSGWVLSDIGPACPLLLPELPNA